MNALDETNVLWENIEKYGDVETFWRLVERYYGYPLKERSIVIFTHLLPINFTFRASPRDYFAGKMAEICLEPPDECDHLHGSMDESSW